MVSYRTSLLPLGTHLRYPDDDTKPTTPRAANYERRNLDPRLGRALPHPMSPDRIRSAILVAHPRRRIRWIGEVAWIDAIRQIVAGECRHQWTMGRGIVVYGDAGR